MGRHSAKRNRTPVVAVTAAAVLLGAGGTLALRHHGDDASPATTAAAPSASGTCASGQTVTVSTTPDLAPALTTVANQLEQRGGAGCVSYDIRAVAAGTEAERLISGGSGRPQVWVPDSPLWVDHVATATKMPLRFGDQVASSPLGLAVPARLAEHGAATGPRTWSQFLASTDRLAMSDPQYSTASLLALVSARRAATKPAQAEELQRTIVELSRTPQDDRSLMTLAAFGSNASSVFPASEQQMYAERSHGAASAPVSAVTLADGAPDFSYGVVAIPPAQGERAAPEAAVSALREALTSQAGRAALVDAGFRVAGVEGPDVPGMVDVRALPTAAQTPSSTELTEALQAWDAVRRTMRMIVAIDVSGSMKQQAAPGMTRIQLAAGAANKALTQLPDATQMGVWLFSTDRGPGHRAWVQASPIVTLGDRTGGTTARERLQGLARTFPNLPKGDTGLYSTISAAVKAVQQDYDPQRVNSVVLMTDGVNDDPGGLTKEALLAELKAQAAGRTPVRVVLVGMGQETDMATLREIATASGGSAYNATEPNAIEKVIIGALTARMEQADAAGSR